MLRNVAAVIWDGVAPFEFGAVCEAFAIDRRDDGVPYLDFAVCAPTAGMVRTNLGSGSRRRTVWSASTRPT
ncbi:hypothetical protein ACFVJS_26395 [Nocardioides sp. NPDC057772]|uniref:hypothetical protein n=1 Tax=Nocardioides sp. NPDC057772 TaxID=3346245 RepID=UPI00366B1233